VSQIPAGRWAVAVSGGADSVALLRLLRDRSDVELIAVHLDHQTRGDESAADSQFVAELCARLNVPCETARRDRLEPTASNLPKNRSARFRALRIALFRAVVKSENLDGVLVAHHADDQAETILLRVLRGSGYRGLGGMSPRAAIGGVRVVRPLLAVRRDALRKFLSSIGQDWREDSSNRSPKYLRNRVRAALRGRDELTDKLLDLGRSCAALRCWVGEAAPRLDDSFRVAALARLPQILAEESAKRWLRARSVRADQITPRSVADLIEMASDAASPPGSQFAGGIIVRRRGGVISAAG